VKKSAVIISLVLLSSIKAIAQIPYFAGTVGDGKLYGYSSMKSRPGINHQETYTTFQYGIGDQFATGIDLYTGPGDTHWGALLRYGYQDSKWFNIGAEVTQSFNLNDNYKFSYLTSALYLNGALTHDNRLFWCTNTWWIINNGTNNTFSNYEYIGYSISLNESHAITPMVGAIHSWEFNQDIDLAAGFYYTFKNWNLYIWGNKLLQSHPRFVIGLDFIL
jgi:hypothetical protein